MRINFDVKMPPKPVTSPYYFAVFLYYRLLFMKIHEKIRFLRKEKNWTQEDMAGKLGMSILGYAKVERGQTNYQSNMENYLSKLEKIANVLNVDLEELLAAREKHIYLIGGDNNGANGSNIVIGSPTELAFEIQKLQLIIEHQKTVQEQKDLLIAQKDKDIARLESMIELMKNQQ